MQNILVLSSSSKGDGPGDILHALRAARYRVACTSLDFAGTDPFRAIGDEFSGRPPDILIAGRGSIYVVKGVGSSMGKRVRQ